MTTPASPAVSIIVLTWNRRALLGETLASLLAQTRGDFEVLVIDNESTDDTAAYVSGLAQDDSRIRYDSHPNGGNLSVNRNHGIRLARGEWIAFCDDDDLWSPAKLERQLAQAAAHEGTRIVSSDAVYFNGDREFGRLVNAAADGDLTLADFLSGSNPIVLSSVLVHSSVFDVAGHFDEDPAIFTVEDLQMWARAAAAGVRIRRLSEPLVRYRVHADMTSHKDTRDTIRKEITLAERLHDSAVITDLQYRGYLDTLGMKLRRATLKEGLKRIPGVKALVYAARAVKWGRAT